MPRVARIHIVSKPSKLVTLQEIPEAIKDKPIGAFVQWESSKTQTSGIILKGVSEKGDLNILCTPETIKAGVFTGDDKQGYIHAFGSKFSKKEGTAIETIIL